MGTGTGTILSDFSDNFIELTTGKETLTKTSADLKSH